MGQRILNLGFFNLTDDYIDMLRKLSVVEEEAFENLRTRTYLPLVDNVASPEEVVALIRAALTVASPKEKDVIIVSGTPDVIYYIMELTPPGVYILCPLGQHKSGHYALTGFREIVRNIDNPEIADKNLADSVFFIADGGDA